MDHVKIYISITFYDDTSNKGTITKEYYEKEFKNLKNIMIQVYCDQQLSSNPFLIKIEKKEKKFNYTIFISVGIIVLLCIICGIIIFCFSRKAAQNTRRQQMLFLQMAMENQRHQRLGNINVMRSSNYDDVASSSESEVSITEVNRQKIKELLENELAPIKYNRNLGFKDGNACTVCTICIEDFKVDISKVSVTPCQHVFHFKCLNDWLMKNLLHPKCPNCNYNLLQEKKNDCPRNQGLNDIPEIPVVISRNSENRMINIQRYNDHNNSIDMGNGLESNENRLIQRNEDNRGIRNNKSSCISSINISSSGSINKSENKKDNLKKIDETRSNKENETVDEVVIENFNNNEEGN